MLALDVCFANYDWSLAVFLLVALGALWLAPRFVRWFFGRFATHVSEPGIKVVLFVLFALGWLAALARSEAVLPAYLVGLVLAGVFAQQRDTVRRLGPTVFALWTPFYFLNAGMKVYASALWSGMGLIAALLLVKLLTKTLGVWPLARMFRLGVRESAYTTLLMSTGLTFGTISSLFGLNNGYVTREQYSILVTVVIGSAIVPTLIAQAYFKPDVAPPVVMEHGASHGGGDNPAGGGPLQTVAEVRGRPQAAS